MLAKLLSIIYFVLTGLIIGYVWLISADQYQSKAYFTITTEDPSKEITGGITDLLSSASSSGSDTQLLLGYITSADLLIELEQELGLAEHYKSPEKDWYFRLEQEAQLEERLKYYREYITATYNVTTGLSEISAWTFEPELAQDILDFILIKSEGFVNKMNTTIASEKLSFVQNQLVESEKSVEAIKKEIADFQNENGLITPIHVIETQLAAINALRQQALELKIKISALEAKNPASPLLVTPRKELKLREEEIKQMEAAIAGSEGKKLNKLLTTFQGLEQRLEFSMQLQQTTQALLEQTRVDAISTTRFFTKVQTPFHPEEPLFPDRKKLTLTILMCAILIFSIISALTRSMFDRM